MIASVSRAALRELLRLDRIERQKPAEVGGGAKQPFLADAHEIDAAIGIILLQPRQHIADGQPIRHPPGDFGFLKRLRRRKQHGLGDPQCLAHQRFIGRHGFTLGLFVENLGKKSRDVGQVQLPHCTGAGLAAASRFLIHSGAKA